MRISDWSSDVCSSDLILLRDGDEGLEVLMVERTGSASYAAGKFVFPGGTVDAADAGHAGPEAALRVAAIRETYEECGLLLADPVPVTVAPAPDFATLLQSAGRSEEHTSELQSLMRISYAVFCL